MEFYVFDKSVVGYKNKIKNKCSQDYLKFEKVDEGLICCIADGHSGSFFTQSHQGSKFACESTIEVIKKYIDRDFNEMNNLLEKKIIQMEICSTWRNLVKSHMKNNLFRVYNENYFRYGTTLISVLIKKEFILYMKLGDGDILLNINNEINKILPGNKNKFVDCMAEDEAHNKILYKIKENKKEIEDIIMFSDGFENSFNNNEDMIKSIKKTMTKYKRNVFSRYLLEKSYSQYLYKLSKNKSYDDISIIFINIL